MSASGDDDGETERNADSASDTAHAETQPASLITKLADSSVQGPPRIRRPSQHELEVGQKIGSRYVVRGFLGMGGMGAVYHVFDETLGEDVALKAVRSAIATSTGMRDEVKIAQKVTHENVCRTYDLEDVDGRHFVKMEYVPGETLAARIEAGRLPIDDAIRIARGVAAGLGAAHARGIVHRDLKPGNVMLDGKRVVLMDFGLAQYANTSEVDRSGTPGYMSPEQLAGVALDHRSDLFALGCLLHEMLTGERVFGTGSMTEIETRQSTIQIPDTRALRPDAPKWLARATSLLLSRDRERRPAGLAMLQRGPVSKLPGVLAVAGVVALGVGATWLAMRGTGDVWKPALQVIRRPMHSTELTSRASSAPDSKTFVVLVDDGTGTPGVVIESPLPGFDPKRLFEVPPKTDLIRHLRDGSGFAMCAGGRGAEKILLADRKGNAVEHASGFDPEDCVDALIAVNIIENGDYWQWELIEVGKAKDSKPRVLFRGEIGQPIDHPRCDREGRRVVFSIRESRELVPIYLLDRTPGAKPVRIAIGETPTFAGDNSIIYSYEGRLIEHFLDDHDEQLITTDVGPYYAPEVSPDGKTLLFSREEYAAAVYLGGPTYPGVGYLVPMELQDLRRAYVTPDRSTVIVQRFGGLPEITAIDARTGKRQLLAMGEALFLSRDGRELYFSPDRRPAELHAVPVTGGDSRLVVEIPKYRVRDGVDGPDGVHLGLMIVDDATMQPTGEMRAVRVPRGTRDVINEGTGMVLPAPTGPWSARGFGNTVELSDGTGKTRRIRCVGPATWLDDHRFACSVEPQRIEILDVTDDKRTPVTLPWPERFAFLLQDGEHWAAVRNTNSITTLAITNFADRPRAP